MLHHQLLRDRGILILAPTAALKAEDFATVAAEVDPYIEESGPLNGILIEAQHFPYWADSAGVMAHLRFVREHHRQVRRVAVVSDAPVLSMVPKLADHFVAAEIRHFAFADRPDAMEWLEAA